MVEQQKKIIPKFQKKLQGFLSDESGKITKEDVLKMSIIAMGVAGMMGSIDPVGAATIHTNSWPHSNSSSISNTHANGGGGWCSASGPWAYSNTVNGHANGSGTAGGSCYGGTASHGNANHANVTTHSSHGSHSSCCGGSW